MTKYDIQCNVITYPRHNVGGCSPNSPLTLGIGGLVFHISMLLPTLDNMRQQKKTNYKFF